MTITSPSADRPVLTIARAIDGTADLIYLVDIGQSTTICALRAAATRTPFVVDTGDLAYALARSTGSHGMWSRQVVRAGEEFMLRRARHVVVRGSGHARFVGHGRVTVVPDVAPPGAGPTGGAALRAELGLDAAFVVGLVGSLVLAPRLGVCYGWEVIEALARSDRSVHALIVGDGSGRTQLEARARSLGVLDRCRFVGRIPPAEVAAYIAAMDVGISTQSNDAVGSVRTTGKLPLYLACGLPVLATDVGEARRVLGPLGWTLPYSGVVDRTYPARLAAAVDALRRDPSQAAQRRKAALTVSRQAFAIPEMRERIRRVIASCARVPYGRRASAGSRRRTRARARSRSSPR